MQKTSYIKKNNVLNDKGTDANVYWAVLNNFLNNIKITSVPPILISGETIANIVEKANISNELFASQCTSLENNSKLASLLMNIDKRLNIISIKKDDILSIIKSLNPAKAHGFDNIPICMVQLCGDSIVLPLVQILNLH